MASGNGNTPQRRGASVLWEAARKFREAAATYRPKGNLEVRGEAWELPDTLDLIAAALHDRASANARENLDPTLNAQYRAIANTVTAAAQAARQLGPAFDAMHAQLITNLTSGPNPAGWDSANNAGGR